MIKKKCIMILGASILQLPAIKKAKDLGYEVIAVDMDESAVGFIYADKSLVISTNDIPNVLNAAEELNIDGIMTLASDMPMRTVATVSEKLNLPGANIETALKATDKARMRDALFKFGVPIPRYYKIRDFKTYINIAKKFNDKFIIKPTDGSGSRGIYLIEDPHDETELKYAFDYCKKYSKSGWIIIEEYMQGREVSVETLSYKNNTQVIAITDKLTTGSPRFVEMGHSQSTNLSNEIKEEVVNITKKAIRAIGLDCGPAHTEIIITKDGPKIVEIGARLGGDNITTHLVPLSTGIDMVAASINIALGLPPRLTQKVNCGSAIRYLSVQPGIIVNIKGIENAKDIEGIKNIYISKTIGDTVEEAINSMGRVGYVIAQGQNANHAIRICENAIAKINIDIIKDCEKT